MDTIAANVAAVTERIARACERAGRKPDEVRLLPVSKTMGSPAVLAAHAAGCRRFGENKVQEALAKARELAGVPELSWALVGHLQTNKAKYLTEFAAEFQALDSLRLAAELDRRLQAAGRGLDVLIEVNSSGEDSKFGLPPDELPAFAARLGVFSALRVRGLMTLAIPSADPRRVAACFATMVRAQRVLRDDDALPGSFDELSMGMSDDFELAIEHGATVVRIGRAIFGERSG